MLFNALFVPLFVSNGRYIVMQCRLEIKDISLFYSPPSILVYTTSKAFIEVIYYS